MGAAGGCASGAAKEDAKGAAAGCASGAAVEFEMGAAGSAVTSNVKLDGGTTATHKGGAGGTDRPIAAGATSSSPPWLLGAK